MIIFQVLKTVEFVKTLFDDNWGNFDNNWSNFDDITLAISADRELANIN